MGLASIFRASRAPARLGSRSEVENLPLNRGVKIDNAISEGEDYELLFAISPRQRKRLLARAGERNSQDFRSRASALLFRDPQSAIRN